MHIVAVSYHYQVFFVFVVAVVFFFVFVFCIFFCVFFCFSGIRDVLQHVNVTCGFDFTKDRSLDN